MNVNQLNIGHVGETQICLDPNTLIKHIAILGSSGSGKTYLSKKVIEESVRLGIPVILIDSQGDLGSLAMAGTPSDQTVEAANEYWKRADVKIWSPGTEQCLPISIDPKLNLDNYERREDRIRALSSMGSELAAIAGFNDEATSAGLAKILDYAQRHNLAIDSLDDVADFLKDPPQPLISELAEIFPGKDRQKVLKSLLIKRNGPRQLMMDLGKPIDVDALFGYEPGGAYDQKKVRVSVICLNALTSLEDRQIFMASLARALYNWMMQDPKTYPVGMLFVDEAANFMPPVRKPVSKEPMIQLLRQARKYGLSVMLATQSPGDLDYVAIGQIGTKFLGRMTTQQDVWKIQPLLSNDANTSGLMDLIPSLQPGEFIGVCADAWKDPIRFRSHTLASNHKTLTLEQMSQYVTEDDRSHLT